MPSYREVSGRYEPKVDGSGFTPTREWFKTEEKPTGGPAAAAQDVGFGRPIRTGTPASPFAAAAKVTRNYGF